MGVSYNINCDWYGTQICSLTWTNPTGTAITGTLRISQDTGIKKVLYHEESARSSTATVAYTIPENLTNHVWIAEAVFNG
jgi:hypothetical protein